MFFFIPVHIHKLYYSTLAYNVYLLPPTVEFKISRLRATTKSLSLGEASTKQTVHKVMRFINSSRSMVYLLRCDCIFASQEILVYRTRVAKIDLVLFHYHTLIVPLFDDIADRRT